jgi:hypothetical protein
MARKPKTRNLLCILLVSLAAGLPVGLSGQEELLRIEASISPRRLARGEEGSVNLKLSLQEGIVISPHPDFIIEFKPLDALVFPKPFFAASDLGIGAQEKEEEEYLDLREPVKIPFTVSPEAKRGSYILEGRIKYYARSRSEGWLVKNSAKFFVAFSARAAAVKKKS